MSAWCAGWGMGALAIALTLGAQPAAAAQHHGLLMWVGQYGSPKNNLPGIDIDAQRARQIASAMGVPEQLRTEVSEAALNLLGMLQALTALEQRVAPGDKVFIYFSGHGKQVDSPHPDSRCSEGLVTSDGSLYLDAALQANLQRLAAKASQAVMMNDSCHSGGAAVKSFGLPGEPQATKGADDEVAKAFPGPVALPATLPSTGANSQALACGQPVNKGGFVRSFGAAGAGKRWLYIAAAREDEVAFASARGSRATRAWHACMSAPEADIDGDGYLSGDELRECAQARVNTGLRLRQHITLQGEGSLRLWPVRR